MTLFPTQETTGGRPVRLGLIGTGLAVTRLHWPALATLRDRFTVVAFSDPQRAAALTFAGQAGRDMADYAPAFETLIARPDVEAVLVAVPIRLSYGIAAAALEAGKHVLCEKPPGGSVAEGRAFLDLARKHPGRAFLMGENFFYRDDLGYARRLLDEGAIGRLRLMDFRFVRRTSVAPGEFASTAWRRRPDHRGGVHLDVGVHHLAQIRMLCGEPVSVQAILARTPGDAAGAATAGGDTETYPALFAHLRFGNGVHGAYQAIFDATAARPGAVMTLYGADGTLTLDGDDVVLLGRDGGERRRTFAGADGGYRREWLDFHAVVREGRAGRGTVAQSFRNLLVVMRALDAAESGASVAIEDEGSEGGQ